ncbi:hypothetical protein GCM10017559_43120 [Streptosporangium longisporum]|uniref:LysR substrate-binding domain-containing protein n=1 Tax=Streptosporangium longisporum TaxID=46187 RepID=A0ABP6KKG1_9ACTN
MVMLGRIDFAFIGACGMSPLRWRGPVVWSTVGIDPVFVLLNEDHPLVEGRREELAELADEQWTVTPGDSCFGTTARHGLPTPVHPPDASTRPSGHLHDLAKGGPCRPACVQGTFQPAKGCGWCRSPGPRCAGGSCSAGTRRPPAPRSRRRSSSTPGRVTPTRSGVGARR